MNDNEGVGPGDMVTSRQVLRYGYEMYTIEFRVLIRVGLTCLCCGTIRIQPYADDNFGLCPDDLSSLKLIQTT